MLRPYSVATRNFSDSDATASATAAQQTPANRHLGVIPDATRCATVMQQTSCTTLPEKEADATAVAQRAIALAALTDAQRQQRLADLRRDPAIARFWALVWPETLNSSSKENQ